MSISVFDLFTVGIGPSSSHTVGPMRAAFLFATRLRESGVLDRVQGVRCELFGSLGATGHGHGSVPAVVLGLLGEQPHLVDPASTGPLVAAVRAEGSLLLAGKHPVAFDVEADVVLHRRATLPAHSNGMVFAAHDATGAVVDRRTYYSVGGGFVLDEDETGAPVVREAEVPVALPFASGDELVSRACTAGLRISDVVLANEAAWRPEPETRAGLLHRWAVMRECVERGSTAEGVLPGSLRVRRRAAAMRRRLDLDTTAGTDTQPGDHVALWALAVNEENAAGGRVVTAPTNGAAGIVPAVLHHAAQVLPGFSDDHVVRFLLTAGAVGMLFKRNASISGAEVGCQGEVGSACSMAAAGLAELFGGTPEQVENAAEIGIEHNLGLTCDPVGGLVQIPCIERNAVASVTAITAARIAVRGDGAHHVSLDQAIRTMRRTGADMSVKYKETARGGLALTVVEC
ncbi:L-serine ammonia-lyase [Actinomycetospora sp. NBRC 106378]|uniref:L-serine ammonia-lyase n=1 Tax=Actinomycetospora sp. NBRC 106378 TaxID=3032208 RepID=UPI0024A4F49D|nr:L-serine ammonia-lyase [Actinomycetospora sp. NBRC 106378]GLZ54648.1 L-serine dehydratase [Actinomycetospora sp. NBRC 106378]